MSIISKCNFYHKDYVHSSVNLDAIVFFENCHHSQFTYGHGVSLKDNAVRLWRQEAQSTIYISMTSQLLLGRTFLLQLRAQSLLPDTVMVLLRRAVVYTCSEDVNPTPPMTRVSVSALLIYSLSYNWFRWDTCCSAALGRNLNQIKQRKMMAPAPSQLNIRRLVCFDVRSALSPQQQSLQRSRPRMAFLRGTRKRVAAFEYLCRTRKGLRSNLNNYLGK